MGLVPFWCGRGGVGLAPSWESQEKVGVTSTMEGSRVLRMEETFPPPDERLAVAGDGCLRRRRNVPLWERRRKLQRAAGKQRVFC